MQRELEHECQLDQNNMLNRYSLIDLKIFAIKISNVKGFLSLLFSCFLSDLYHPVGRSKAGFPICPGCVSYKEELSCA